MSTNNKISNLVYSQLPFFVRNDHPNFVAFMEAYYEYLEQDVGNNIDGKAIERGKNLANYVDVDKTIGIFADKLYSHFLHLMPKDTLADKDKLIKRILDFYRARGTEKAAKFLIRILFDEDLDFYYPKSDILKASDGKWFIERNINIEDVAVNNVANANVTTLDYFVQRLIYGATSNSSAAVDKVSRSIINGVTTDKLFLSYINGRFLEGEKIYTRVPFGSNTLYLTANISYNSVTNIVVTNKGSLYNVGDYISIESANSVNVPANAQVTLVSKGEIYELELIKRGAGFQAGNQLEFIEDYGSNANGIILSVLDNNFYHPNSYNLISSTIQLEANTPLNNAKFSNLNTSIVSSPNVNSLLYQVFDTTKISGLGPILQIKLTSMGSDYRSSPIVDAKSNTMLRELGILGRMDIISGGENYQINDTLVFTNPEGYPGFGAAGNVRNVSAAGRITEVGFTQYNNELIGGSGYIDPSTQEPRFPDVTVTSGTGNGAIIRVSALLGDGEKIHAANNSYGGIEKITINESGYNYIGIPTINLQSSGDGTAQGYAVMSTGFESSEGRYLNDDGFISAYNFLQDRDYYQNYSYVMIVKQNLKNYRDAVKSLLHPAGMKLFGEYDFNSNIIEEPLDVEVESAIFSTSIDYGQVLFNIPGTYIWTAPIGVTNISAVCVGAGGGGGAANTQILYFSGPGGGGGGLGWKNNIQVVPGQSYTIVVGEGGKYTANANGSNGGTSYVISPSTVAGLGGNGGLNANNGILTWNTVWGIAANGGSGGTFVGDGGGNGGNGGASQTNNDYVGGGGGAGGYSGNGGDGSAIGRLLMDGSQAPYILETPAGGGGAGGQTGSGYSLGILPTSGGGVGVYGEGTSGSNSGGAYVSNSGEGGSGGANGTTTVAGVYGGGAPGKRRSTGTPPNGANGAVRIIWGVGRAFPSTNTGNVFV